jgi:hypothetical protein
MISLIVSCDRADVLLLHPVLFLLPLSPRPLQMSFRTAPLSPPLVRTQPAPLVGSHD